MGQFNAFPLRPCVHQVNVLSILIGHLGRRADAGSRPFVAPRSRPTVWLTADIQISFQIDNAVSQRTPADHFLKAAGIPAVYVDEAGAIGTVDVVGIDTPSAWRLLCCAPGKQIGIATKAVAQAAAPSTNAKERVPCLQLRDKPPVMSAGRKVENQAQEQTQTIATAIGKPAAKAPNRQGECGKQICLRAHVV